MIHFKGNSDLKKKNNNCVKNGFACGLRPTIPEWINFFMFTSCRRNGPFIDMFSNSEDQCKQGFFVAIREKDGIGILDVEDSPTRFFYISGNDKIK